MADPRFYRRSGPFALGAVAEAIGAVLQDPASAAIPIDDIAALEAAGPGDLTLLSDPRHLGAVAQTRAGAILTTPALSAHANGRAGLLLAKDARLAFAKAGNLFYPAEAVEPAIDPLARIDAGATIAAGCRIEAGASIAAGAEIGARCHIGANVVVGSGVVIGPDCRIGPNTTIGYAIIGARVEIGSCCSIGGPGFGFVPGPAGLLRMPQLGRVIIEDGVRIDANCAIDRGASGDTVIGAGTAIDNLVQIAHNVRIGRHCAIAGQAGVAGSTVIGDGVLIGGQVAVSDHLTVGSGARIAGKSGVSRDVEPGVSVGGYPAIPVRQWHRQTAALNRLLDRPAAAAEPVAAPAGDGVDRG